MCHLEAKEMQLINYWRSANFDVINDRLPTEPGSAHDVVEVGKGSFVLSSVVMGVVIIRELRKQFSRQSTA